jgi:hypothetical protein
MEANCGKELALTTWQPFHPPQATQHHKARSPRPNPMDSEQPAQCLIVWCNLQPTLVDLAECICNGSDSRAFLGVPNH